MNRAFFLDRDGVINVDGQYVSAIDDFQFIDGVFAACKTIVANGYKIIIITNQSGIGRGYYTEKQFLALNRWMLQQFAKQGISVTDVYFCPHHPVQAFGPYKMECHCRKPKPGMLYQAEDEHQIDLGLSVLVGDRPTDIEAGKAAGVGSLYWVSPKPRRSADIHSCTSLKDAVQQYFE